MTQVYLAIAIDEAQDMLTVEKTICTKESANVTVRPTEGDDELGVYYNGMGYASSQKFLSTADLAGRRLVMVSKGKDTPKFVWGFFVGTPPGNGVEVSSFQVYKEHDDDDGVCIQDGVSYVKYQGTIPS